MPALSDKELMKYLQWPKTAAMTPKRFRETLESVRMFIDFDQTIAYWVRDKATRILSVEFYSEILGVPTCEFLAREPYIIQSHAWCDWNVFLWELHVEHRPSLPLPEMVIFPPTIEKNFVPFGIIGKVIVDNLELHEIHAPGNLVLHVDADRSK